MANPLRNIYQVGSSSHPAMNTIKNNCIAANSGVATRVHAPVLTRRNSEA